VVAAATFVCLYLCYLLARPFLPALVWAITGAVITRPLVRPIEKRIPSATWRAALAVAATTIVVFGPVLAIVYFAAIEISQAVGSWQPSEILARWQEVLDRYPRLSAAWQQLSENVDLARALEQFTAGVQQSAAAIATGFIYTLVQTLLALFILFYLYRDQDRVLAAAKELSPLTTPETERLLTRLGDTIHATIYGTVVVAMVQGAIGGFMFWLLGLPGPLLWGTVMTLLAIVPYLGAFVVWFPAALFLFSQGEWIRGGLLSIWGILAVGLIDNLLYPILVGSRLKQHTVIAFLAIVGGITVFGASGIVLGPVIVTLTFFLLETWRRRTAAT
jgi:predicted PurR-regulated permease PerM